MIPALMRYQSQVVEAEEMIWLRRKDAFIQALRFAKAADAVMFERADENSFDPALADRAFRQRRGIDIALR
jgi:hypothetical protein